MTEDYTGRSPRDNEPSPEEVMRRANLSSYDILTLIWAKLEELNTRLMEIERQTGGNDDGKRTDH